MTPTKAAFSETIAVLVEKKAVLVGTKGVFVGAKSDLNFVRTDTNFAHSLSHREKANFFVSNSKFPPNLCTFTLVLCLNIDAMTPPSYFVSIVTKIQASSPSTNLTENSIKTSILLYFAKNPNIKFVKIFRNSARGGGVLPLVLKLYNDREVVAEAAAEHRALPGAPRLDASVGLVTLKQEVVADDTHGGSCDMQMAARIKQSATDDALVEHLPVALVAVGATRMMRVATKQ